jgi:hypothetical protein
MRDFSTFWGKPDRWPRDRSTNVFLGRAIDRIGRTMFGAEWRGVFDIVAKPTDPIPLYKAHALPWQIKHAFELYLRHRPEPPLDAFSVKRKTLNDKEWQVARDLIRKLNNDVRPFLERYNSVERAIIVGAEEGRLVTTLMPTAGGQFTEAPTWWWNSETISNRFDMCQMNPSDPFGRGFAGDGYCWIFVTQESLASFCESLRPTDPIKQTIAVENQCQLWLEQQFSLLETEGWSKWRFQTAATEKFGAALGTKMFLRAWDAAVKKPGNEARRRSGRKRG